MNYFISKTFLLAFVCIWNYLDGYSSTFRHSTLPWRSFPLPVTSKEIPPPPFALQEYLRLPQSQQILMNLALQDPRLKNDMKKANFWTSGMLTIEQAICDEVTDSFIVISVKCNNNGRQDIRKVTISIPKEFSGDTKGFFIKSLSDLEMYREAGAIAKLPFEMSYKVPTDMLLNNIPHANWVRNYFYKSAAESVYHAINDPQIADKSRLKLTINTPETNPEFDTYRVATLLELVREISLTLLEKNRYKIRICVQQSLGEGIRSGLPIALGSVRAILERMDWGPLPEELKYQQEDRRNPRPEALIRLGQVGKEQIQPDDDVIIIIAPQNSIGGMITELLREMVEAAKGRPLILINPNLKDRPSSDNIMSTTGRGDRIKFSDSFQEIYSWKLLYPSSGGMYPIRGLLAKFTHSSPWVLYDKKGDGRSKEFYDIIAAFPPSNLPSPSIIGRLLDQ